MLSKKFFTIILLLTVSFLFQEVGVVSAPWAYCSGTSSCYSSLSSCELDCGTGNCITCDGCMGICYYYTGVCTHGVGCNSVDCSPKDCEAGSCTEYCELYCGAHQDCDEKKPTWECGEDPCDPDYCLGTCGEAINSCMWEIYDSDTCTKYCDDDCDCPPCECTSTPHDPDDHSTYCSGCGLSYNIGGEDCDPETGGLQQVCCCGDDSGEYRGEMFSGYDEIWNEFMTGDNPSDDACCNRDHDCVYQDTCYSAGEDPLCPNPADADRCKWDVTGDGRFDGFCGWGTWYDCDSYSGDCGKCGYDWIETGDGDISEYYLGQNPNYPLSCCGDDPGEYVRTCVSEEEGTGNENVCDGSTEEICCDSSSDCVFNGQCYTEDEPGQYLDGDAYKEVCHDGTWYTACSDFHGGYEDSDDDTVAPIYEPICINHEDLSANQIREYSSITNAPPCRCADDRDNYPYFDSYITDVCIDVNRDNIFYGNPDFAPPTPGGDDVCSGDVEIDGTDEIWVTASVKNTGFGNQVFFFVGVEFWKVQISGTCDGKDCSNPNNWRTNTCCRKQKIETWWNNGVVVWGDVASGYPWNQYKMNGGGCSLLNWPTDYPTDPPGTENGPYLYCGCFWNEREYDEVYHVLNGRDERDFPGGIDPLHETFSITCWVPADEFYPLESNERIIFFVHARELDLSDASGDGCGGSGHPRDCGFTADGCPANKCWGGTWWGDALALDNSAAVKVKDPSGPVNPCSDSDYTDEFPIIGPRGWNPRKRGTVRMNGVEQGEDHCSGGKLVEYYCNADFTDYLVDDDIDCTSLDPDYVCKAGLCQTPGGGGSCPTLYVYDGKEYKEERISNLHSQEGVDTVDEISLTVEPVEEDGYYKLSLREQFFPGHSHVDSVKLFVDDKETKLISAMHSKYGDVTAILKESDDKRTDTKLWDEIELKFEALPGESFVFKIEGYNPLEKGSPLDVLLGIMPGRPPLKIMIGFTPVQLTWFAIIVSLLIIVIFYGGLKVIRKK